MATKPHMYPQNIHKVAAIDRQKPGLTVEEVAEEIGSTPKVVYDTRRRIARANGDLEVAIRERNASSLQTSKKTRDEARRWRKKADDEWKASGIPDPVVVADKLGTTKIERVAAIDQDEPGLKAREVAERIRSTANAVGTYRFWLRKANGDAKLAYQMQRKGLPVGIDWPDL